MRYYYTYGDGVGGWSEEFSFVAAPKPGPSVTTRVVAFGGESYYDDKLLVDEDLLNAWHSKEHEASMHDLLPRSVAIW